MRENNHRLSVQQPDGSWQQLHGVRSAKLEASAGTHDGGHVVDLGRITGAGRRLTSWLRALGPRRALLGLEPATPAPYRPHNRARMAQRRARRRMVARSRRANRR